MPAWRQLANHLRAQIESGEITNRLPSERHLMQQYGIAEKTVRKTMAWLRQEQLVITVHGLGTFIKRDADQ